MLAGCNGWYDVQAGTTGAKFSKGRQQYMATLLSKPLKRALNIGGADYVLMITAEGFTLTPKGKRKGQSWSWGALLSGEAGLTAALNASVNRDESSDGSE